MSNLIFAAVLPHGDVIPELAGEDAYKTNQTHLGMTEVGAHLNELQPDTIVIATPHGIRVDGKICIAVTESVTGELSGNGKDLTFDMQVDQELAQAIAAEATVAAVPTVRCIYGSASGPASALPLDWGAFIPLWYCGANWDIQPKVVVFCPSREVNGELLVEFGRAVSRAADACGKRVAFIASCDWAHAQAPNGPYGYHPDAARYDAMVQEIIQQNDLLRFLNLDPEFIENAKPDGNWQCLILAGTIENTTLRPKLLSYQCPTYFGMLVAEYL